MGLLFFIAIGQALLLNESVVVDHFHVCPLAEVSAQDCLAGGFRANDAGDLWEHCAPRVLIDVDRVAIGVNAANFAELLVVCDDWEILLVESFKTLLDGLCVVIGATLSAAQETLHASLLRAVEKEDVLSLDDIRLKVGALVYFPGEPIDQIVLRWVIDQCIGQKLHGQLKRCILALVNELLEPVSVTCTLLDLGADQVTSRDMSVAELLDELLALSAFATTWGSSDEGDFGVAKLCPHVNLLSRLICSCHTLFSTI